MIFYDFAHKSLSLLYFIFLKTIRRDLQFVGAKRFRENFKNSDTLFAMATGASISDYSKTDFEIISNHDSIGVNFFIIHDFMPSFYIMEPHKSSLGLFDILSKKQETVSGIPYLYKGYSSPCTLARLFDNIKSIPETEKAFLIMKDSWAKGEWRDMPKYLIDQILDSNQSDYFYNYIASIIYIVFMAYKVGYKNIVLCGFDMDDKYFYCTNKKYQSEANLLGLCNKTAVNKIANDKWRRNTIIEILVFIDEKLKTHREGRLYVYSKKMSLSRYFPEYTYDQ